MKILALVPARGGSKGIPRKNLMAFEGKTLVEWAIHCAATSKHNPTIVLDTDDEEIANTNHATPDENFHIHIRRPVLGDDHASIVDVAKEALLNIEAKLRTTFDLIVLLQPTSPLRTSIDFDRIIALFEQNNQIQNVISVIQHDDIHPGRMYHMTQDGLLDPVDQTLETKRRQELPAAYLRNGCFYAIRRDSFIQHESFMLPEKTGYTMPIKWWLNIDEPFDIERALFLFPKWLEACL